MTEFDSSFDETDFSIIDKLEKQYYQNKSGTNNISSSNQKQNFQYPQQQSNSHSSSNSIIKANYTTLNSANVDYVNQRLVNTANPPQNNWKNSEPKKCDNSHVYQVISSNIDTNSSFLMTKKNSQKRSPAIKKPRTPKATTSDPTPPKERKKRGAPDTSKAFVDLPPPPAFDSPPLYDEQEILTWIYPTNKSVRDYQFSIVQSALFFNTLVCLPTGLGKTFIAAVVMYNFYRWFPHGKIIFVAPTKPLVAQQIEACQGIVGISPSDCIEMTGQVGPLEREEPWRTKRIFFVTPQVIVNDIRAGTCDASKIVCVVMDEAHKAQGNHSYCQVIREILQVTRYFRVLALSATPGSDATSIQNVVSNLLISHLEIRDDVDTDVKKYVHTTEVETIVVPLSSEIMHVKSLFLEILQIPVEKLYSMKVLFENDPGKLTQFTLVFARDKMRNNPPNWLDSGLILQIEGYFGIAISLYAAWKILNSHGLASFKSNVEKIHENAMTGKGKMKRDFFSTLVKWKELRNLLEQITDKGNNHPKLAKLESLLVEHFSENQDDTRAMVFVQFRDSVSEIVTLLAKYSPLIRPMVFVGQASGNGSKGLTQKEQTEVIQNFRDGHYNTLVATCIGEEGLDIGEVDLIICFDAQYSPTRLTQRMGRTGRRRDGRVVVLLTEGVEENVHKKSQLKKKSIFRSMSKHQSEFVFYQENPRMIPDHIEPEYILQDIELPMPTTSSKTSSKKNSTGFLNSTEEQYYKKKFYLPQVPLLSFQKSNISFSSPISQIPHSSKTMMLLNFMSVVNEESVDIFDLERLNLPSTISTSYKYSSSVSVERTADSTKSTQNNQKNKNQSLNESLELELEQESNDIDSKFQNFVFNGPEPTSSKSNPLSLVFSPLSSTVTHFNEDKFQDEFDYDTVPIPPPEKEEEPKKIGKPNLILSSSFSNPSRNFYSTSNSVNTLNTSEISSMDSPKLNSSNLNLLFPVNELFPIYQDESNSLNPSNLVIPSPPNWNKGKTSVVNTSSSIPDPPFKKPSLNLVIPKPSLIPSSSSLNNPPNEISITNQKTTHPNSRTLVTSQPKSNQENSSSVSNKSPILQFFSEATKQKTNVNPIVTSITNSSNSNPKMIPNSTLNSPNIETNQQININSNTNPNSNPPIIRTKQLNTDSNIISDQTLHPPKIETNQQININSNTNPNSNPPIIGTKQKLNTNSNINQSIQQTNSTNSISSNDFNSNSSIISPNLKPQLVIRPPNSTPESEYEELPLSLKKRYAYQTYLNRPSPPNKGKKAIPVGAKNCLAGKVFVITGVLDSLERSEAEDLIKQYSGEVKPGISKKTTHLIVGLEPGNSKMEALKKMPQEIQQINEDQLFEFIRTFPEQPDPVISPKTKKRKKMDEEETTNESLTDLEEKKTKKKKLMSPNKKKEEPNPGVSIATNMKTNNEEDDMIFETDSLAPSENKTPNLKRLKKGNDKPQGNRNDGSSVDSFEWIGKSEVVKNGNSYYQKLKKNGKKFLQVKDFVEFKVGQNEFLGQIQEFWEVKNCGKFFSLVQYFKPEQTHFGRVKNAHPKEVYQNGDPNRLSFLLISAENLKKVSVIFWNPNFVPKPPTSKFDYFFKQKYSPASKKFVNIEEEILAEKNKMKSSLFDCEAEEEDEEERYMSNEETDDESESELFGKATQEFVVPESKSPIRSSQISLSPVSPSTMLGLYRRSIHENSSQRKQPNWLAKLKLDNYIEASNSSNSPNKESSSNTSISGTESSSSSSSSPGFHSPIKPKTVGSYLTKRSLFSKEEEDEEDDFEMKQPKKKKKNFNNNEPMNPLINKKNNLAPQPTSSVSHVYSDPIPDFNLSTTDDRPIVQEYSLSQTSPSSSPQRPLMTSIPIATTPLTSKVNMNVNSINNNNNNGVKKIISNGPPPLNPTKKFDERLDPSSSIINNNNAINHNNNHSTNMNNSVLPVSKNYRIMPLSPKSDSVIIVGRSELNCPVISSLRTQYNLKTVVTKLPNIDYVVSERAAVLKKQKLNLDLQSLRLQMQHILSVGFEFIYVILQMNYPTSKKPIYPQSDSAFDNILTDLLSMCQISVLCSNSDEETTILLAQIVSNEKRAGKEIHSSCDHILNENKEVVAFLQTVPFINIAKAVNLISSHLNLASILNALKDEAEQTNNLILKQFLQSKQVSGTGMVITNNINNPPLQASTNSFMKANQNSSLINNSKSSTKK